MYSCSIFIYLKKAFDTVAHSILLGKLDHYGVCGVINDWFAFYLLGRQPIEKLQFVLNTAQKKEVTSSGVTQGLVLGPLLFLVYKSDISSNSDLLK